MYFTCQVSLLLAGVISYTMICNRSPLRGGRRQYTTCVVSVSPRWFFAGDPTSLARDILPYSIWYSIYQKTEMQSQNAVFWPSVTWWVEKHIVTETFNSLNLSGFFINRNNMFFSAVKTSVKALTLKIYVNSILLEFRSLNFQRIPDSPSIQYLIVFPQAINWEVSTWLVDMTKSSTFPREI